MKNKKLTKIIILIAIVIVIVVVGVFIIKGSNKNTTDIDKGIVKKGTIVNCVSADGTIQPVTNVEIKSNVGGTIIKLYADEGDYVKAGQLLALVDPTDVKTTLDKETNNVVSAKAKLASSVESLAIQKKQSESDLKSAEEKVKSCELKLANAKHTAKIQPTISNNEIATAQANLTQAKTTLSQMKKATNNQKIASAKSDYESALASYNANEKIYERNQKMVEKGYLSKQDYESAEQQYLSSKATLESTKEKYDTIKDEVNSDLKVQEEKVKSCEIALKNAKANIINIDMRNNDVATAESDLIAAKSALVAAKANLKQITVKENAVTQAKADLLGSQASLTNAQTYYNYTNITAPRDGVIVKKWTEEGSIIMAGKNSTAGSSEGVVIFELADITKMEVKVDVDETDVAAITVGQRVKISVDAFPNTNYQGHVKKICPSAETESGVTTVPVKVLVEGVHEELKPEMNATCDFIIDTKKDILTAPFDFVDVKGDTGTTCIMGEDKKLQTVQFKVGLIGEESVEVLDTLKAGQEIISPKMMTMIEEAKGGKQNTDKTGKGGNKKKMGPPPM